MKILSLFDGMSCGQIALNRCGIKYDQYFASEIDKHAIKVTQANYPGTIQLDSIVNVHAKDLPKIDLIMGGSPCQGFSFAGKGLNFEDPRSKLFFEFVRLVKEVMEINPNAKFLLENVQMKKEHEIIISRYMGVNPIVINSALVSAQNRTRYYWTNINNKAYGMFGDMFADIPQPKDKEILLKDILQKDVVGYDISEKMVNQLINIKNRMPVDPDGKASCFTAGANSGGVHSQMDFLAIYQRPRGFNEGGLHEEKSPTLSSNSWQHNNFLLLNERQQKKYKTGDQKANAFLSTSHKGSQANGMTLVDSGVWFRRLTEIECERLQTVPDNYTQGVSSTQRYKMLGNGWNVDTICHILNYLNPLCQRAD